MKNTFLVAVSSSLVILAQGTLVCPSAFADDATSKSSSSTIKTSSSTSAAGTAIGILPQRMRHAVHEAIEINAPPGIVWHCMEKQRTIDPDSTSVKTGCKNGVVNVEQKFSFPCPPFGSAECTLKLAEVVNQRVDFKLMESDDLKAMEGSWVLTPSEDGKTCKLELYSYVEPFLPIPRFICNALSTHKAKKNLGAVKKLAEQNMLSQK